MKTRLLFSLAVLTTFSMKAQDETTEAYTRDLGFNTAFIIQGLFQSNQTPFSVMYKSYSGENKAFRLGLNASVNISDNDANSTGSNNPYTNSSNTSVELTLGKEFQQKLAGRWIWYYGLDMVPSFGAGKNEHFNNNEKTSLYKNSYIGLSAKPLVGIRYNINARLYLSAEASAALRYSITKSVEKRYNPDETLRDVSGKNISFNISPASGFFIFYRF